MITKTSLKSRRYLARVRRAVVHAVSMARGSKSGVCVIPVTNYKGDLSAYVVARVGGPLEFHDAHDNDVSAIMLEALRDYHANLQSGVIYPRAGA